MNRSPSTISREVCINGGRQAYRAARSDQRVWVGATRPKPCKLSFNDPLCQLIARKLRKIKGVIPASERLPEVDDRAVPAIGRAT
jgi:IS30 family transposase